MLRSRWQAVAAGPVLHCGHVVELRQCSGAASTAAGGSDPCRHGTGAGGQAVAAHKQMEALLLYQEEPRLSSAQHLRGRLDVGRWAVSATSALLDNEEAVCSA